MLSTLLSQAPPDQLVELALPHVWASVAEQHGAPANICVDAALTLRHAFGQFGIRAELQPVDLLIWDQDGDREVFSTNEQMWGDGGRVFRGHCLLTLPDSGRIVDATIEQFKQLATLNMGPLIGKTAAATVDVPIGELLPAGARMGVQRGPLMLVYTIADGPRASALDDTQPYVREHAAAHRRTGVNLASLMLMLLRSPDMIGRARRAPYPRLRALLHAVADAEEQVDDARNIRFLLPGTDGQPQPLLLDDIPLPSTTPAPHPLLSAD